MHAQSKVGSSWGVVVLGAWALSACGGVQTRAQAGSKAGEPPPEWVTHIELDKDRLCGLGVAGAGFDESSPYPKQLSLERAARNLAGILGTQIEEAIIDKSTNGGTSIETARVLHVDDDMVAKIQEIAEADYWLDRAGVGPYAQKNFTYAHVCIDASVAAATFKVDPSKLASEKAKPVSPEHVPGWIGQVGTQSGGKLCAVGYSLPMFFADKTFEGVVEDVRGQLAEVIETLVSSYYEELANNRMQAFEAMTVATTQAISKGVIVTEFWYDQDGIGPNKHQRTTYGWGCVYPMDVLQQGLAAAEEKLPEEEQNKIAQVRERAANAFANLDDEIEKRENKAGSGGTAKAEEARTE